MPGEMKKLYSYAWAAIIVILVWHLASALLNSPIIPPPHTVMKVFVSTFPGKILPHLLASLKRILLAMLAAFSAALPLGILAGRSEGADRFLSPLVYFFYPIPKIAFLPVILVLAGLGEASKVILIAIIVFFHLVVAVRDSSKNVSREVFYALEVMGAGRGHFLRHIIIPAILPSVFTALRISLGTAIAVLFFSETVVADRGIGFFIMDSWIRVNYPEMYASIAGLSLMGLLLFIVVDLAEGALCSWKGK